MSVKYKCPKCEKRFVEWGAEKLKFKCPNCEDEQLIRVGGESDTTSSKRPTLKRQTKQRAAEVALLKTELNLEDSGEANDVLVVQDTGPIDEAGKTPAD